MAFKKNNETYAWLNQSGGFTDYISQDEFFNTTGATGGVPNSSPANPGGNTGMTGTPSSFPPCTATLNQCPCSYSGCMDSSATNYNAAATCDDGSCIATVTGCMTSGSINYNPNANVDDGSCIGVVSGCTDPAAYNYNQAANTDCNGGIVSGGGTVSTGAQGATGGAGVLGGTGGSGVLGGIPGQGTGNYGSFNGYSNACGGSAYSNFNEQGFGGYEDRGWFGSEL